MTQTAHSLGRIYVVFGVPQGQGSPLIDRACTIERDGQERTGAGLLIRIPFTRHRPTHGIVIGIWRKKAWSWHPLYPYSNSGSGHEPPHPMPPPAPARIVPAPESGDGTWAAQGWIPPRPLPPSARPAGIEPDQPLPRHPCSVLQYPVIWSIETTLESQEPLPLSDQRPDAGPG